MKGKRLSAGEIRFRVSKKDLARIDWILDERQGQSTSSMLRSLIYEEWLRTQPRDSLTAAENLLTKRLTKGK